MTAKVVRDWLAQIGMTLYVIKSVRREGTIKDVFVGTTPFVIAMIFMTGLLIAFPEELVLWLPSLFFE
jgi:C4-dicarboxylate transporter DctM subunit